MEKHEKRVCLRCAKEKRTTVRQEEEGDYYCEDCKKEVGYKLLLGKSDKLEIEVPKEQNGLNIIINYIVIFIIGLAIGIVIGVTI